MRTYPSRVRHLSPVEAAWVGALFEGEGCVNFPANAPRYNHTHLTITNTSVETIATVLRLVGDGNICCQFRQESRRRPLWRWNLNNAASIKALSDQILPYVTDKYERLLVAIERAETLCGSH